MNKTLITLVIIILVLIGGGLIYSMRGDLSGIATTTPEVIGNDNTNTSNTSLPQRTAPIVITSSAVSPSDTTAIVNGEVNPKGVFTSYWYEYGINSSLGSKTVNQTMGSGFVSIKAPGYITNLSKNTTYYFRLVAENQYGRVTGNQFTFKTTNGTPAPVGSAPTTKTISASGISRTTANINGEVNPNKFATQYWFEYGETPELGNVSAFSSGGEGNAKVPVSISLSDLEPLTTYYFRLNAQNQFGTVNGSILNFKTLGPAGVEAPQVISKNATAVTTSGATLHGTVNPKGAETKYWFEYSTDTLLGSVLFTKTTETSIAGGVSAVPVDIDLASLSPRTTYYFRLVAENSKGLVRGSEITFKTK